MSCDSTPVIERFPHSFDITGRRLRGVAVSARLRRAVPRPTRRRRRRGESSEGEARTRQRRPEPRLYTARQTEGVDERNRPTLSNGAESGGSADGSEEPRPPATGPSAEAVRRRTRRRRPNHGHPRSRVLASAAAAVVAVVASGSGVPQTPVSEESTRPKGRRAVAVDGASVEFERSRRPTRDRTLPVASRRRDESSTEDELAFGSVSASTE